ncbi:MAG TPA: glucokinase [Candidatus Dormibacteraeota bacterium]|nr:glucokinase [Candidatus Dormibacteraeota bacterium]
MVTTSMGVGDGGPLLLAVDVGGTKTDLAVVSAAGGPRETLARRRYASASFPDLAEMARAFLADAGLRVRAMCVGVAGPVIDGRARLTNLDWRLDEGSLAAELGLDRVWLVNDLVATACAMPLLRPAEVRQVKEGQARPGDPIAVLAPGTGLGEAFLTWEGDPGGSGSTGYVPHASEGGHAAFAPSSELEAELLRTLWRHFDHVSVERVASGVGIPNIYAFLRDQQGMAESPELAHRLAGTDERARAVIEAAVGGGDPDPLARATVTLFLRILGGEAANLALKVLATGGVYLAGGIAQALRGELGSGPFLDAFVRAGRFSAMLNRVPVFVAMDEMALLGAAGEGLRLLAATAGPGARQVGRTVH